MNDEYEKILSDDSGTRPESFYPEGVKALKEHLRFGVEYYGFKELSMPDLLGWVSGLLEYNGQFCMSVNELVFRLHLKTGVPVNGEYICIWVPIWNAVNFLRLFGKNEHQAMSLGKEAVEKLLDAGLLREGNDFYTKRKRKGWKKNIPGLSRVRVPVTTINNPENLSFDELIARVRALG